MEFGAFVNFFGAKDGLVHISQLAPHRVGKVSDVVKEGDKVKVKLLGFDERGKMRLSMKVVDQQTGEDLTEKLKAERDSEKSREQANGGGRVKLPIFLAGAGAGLEACERGPWATLVVFSSDGPLAAGSKAASLEPETMVALEERDGGSPPPPAASGSSRCGHKGRSCLLGGAPRRRSERAGGWPG